MISAGSKFLAAWSALNIAGASAGDVCLVAQENKVDCKKFSEGDCQAAGCCWHPVDPNPQNVPWCYKKAAQKCSFSADPKTPFSSEELVEVRKLFTANINLNNTGMVVAAPDHNTPGGDYFFAWMRDGALSMNAYMQTADAFGLDEKKTTDAWLAWVERAQNQADPNGIDILTEPKFSIPSGVPYTGAWCRPQNDGPGLRAITLMALVDRNPSAADRAWKVMKQELDWVAANYTRDDGCDLWEEVRSADLFWTRFTMRKALLQGSQFASKFGKDKDRSAKYAAVAVEITKALSSHVQADGFVCEVDFRCKDAAVIDAFNVGYTDDEVFAPLSKPVVSTLSGLSEMFCNDFNVNQDAAQAGSAGVLFGRYKGDIYAGGNPWILLTASAANLFYRQAEALAQNKALDDESSKILEQLLGRKVSPQNLIGAGDAALILMKKFLTNGMHMNEQIDRNSGQLISAKDLTWNYANVLKAMKGRRAAKSAMQTAQTVVV